MVSFITGANQILRFDGRCPSLGSILPFQANTFKALKGRKALAMGIAHRIGQTDNFFYNLSKINCWIIQYCVLSSLARTK